MTVWLPNRVAIDDNEPGLVPGFLLFTASLQECGVKLLSGMAKFHSGNPRNDISPEALREMFSCDPVTGILYKKGRRVGWHHPATGYRYVSIGDREYKEHRIIWAVHYGAWPVGQIDHLNRRRDDNRICNLADVSGSQNQENIGLRKDNKSGFRGVAFVAAASKFAASYYENGRRVYVGLFDSAEEAFAARQRAMAGD